MITRVHLRNWRGYEKLALDLGPGLTFVIADNGVGKTSLVNGVTWALFGEASGIDGATAIRAGTTETTAEVELAIGGTTFSVARTLRRAGRSRMQLAARIDGRDATAAELRTRLAEAAAVPHEILPQLMLVPEMQLTHEGQLFADVQDHLSGLLGIDHLRRAARTARQVQATTARLVRAARQAAQVDEAILARARAAARAAEDELAEIDRSLEARADQLRRLDAVRDDLAAWGRYDDATAAYQRQLEELAEAARVAGLAVAAGTEGRPAAADLEPVLDAQEHIARQARELTTELAEARAQESLVRGLIDQLDAAGAVCPVCLRPVDGEVAEHAAGAHRARLAEIEARQAAAEQRHGEVAAAAERVGAIATALARLRPPEAPGVPRPATDAEAVETERANLRELVDAELGRRGALGEQLAQAERVIAEADRSQAAAAELARHSAVEAAAGALAELATAEADARTEQRLDPLSRTLARRWAEFFVGSGTRPRLAGGGSIELGHPTAAISYASFSGGEKTLASLLTRLLFVTSATGLDCMWLDEPLEHLDPANRTRVARLLAQVVQPRRRLRQVLVTTYEEALARSTIERHEAAGIVYVSTDELL